MSVHKSFEIYGLIIYIVSYTMAKMKSGEIMVTTVKLMTFSFSLSNLIICQMYLNHVGLLKVGLLGIFKALYRRACYVV